MQSKIKRKILFVVSLVILSCFAILCYCSEIITGKWLVKKEVFSSGYISRAPSGKQKKIIGKYVYLGSNCIEIGSKKHINLIQKVEVLSDDEIFKGWHINLTDLGVNDRSVKVLHYIVRDRNDVLPLSEFILTSNGDLIAITEDGLFKLVKLTK